LAGQNDTKTLLFSQQKLTKDPLWDTGGGAVEPAARRVKVHFFVLHARKDLS
jgi:hypothetical protein